MIIASAIGAGYLDSTLYSLTGYFDQDRCYDHYKDVWPIEVWGLWDGGASLTASKESLNAKEIIYNVEKEFHCAGLCSSRTTLYYNTGTSFYKICYKAIRSKVKGLVPLIIVPGILYALVNFAFCFSSCCCLNWVFEGKSKTPEPGTTFNIYKAYSKTGQNTTYPMYLELI